MFNNASHIDASHSTFSEVHRDQYIYSKTHVQGNQTTNTIVHGSQVFRGTFGLENLHRASVPGAAFDSIDRHPAPTCLPGTRLELLARLMQWIDDSQSGQHMCWLSGLAGSGKSAIAQSIAEKYAAQHRLAASFFFSRKEVLRRRAQGFFPTLACQMSVFAPSIKPALLDTLDEDAAIPTKVLLEQARRLLQDPIASSTDSFPIPILIVVDSLDECDDVKMANEIVHLLAGVLRQCRWPLKVLFTSRPEQLIVQNFHLPELRGITYPFRLQDFGASEDIRAYLYHSFGNIRKSMDAISVDAHPPQWPSEYDIETIVQKADGLFIFATTVVKHLSTEFGSPVKQLQAVLWTFQDDASAQNSPVHSSLDMLYLDALRTIQDTDKVRLTLGLVVFAFRPLSIRGLNDLLWDSQFDVTYFIKNLCAVLAISDSDTETDGAIRVYHTSFRDFLTNPYRSLQYFVDPASFHGILARACLELMIRHLKTDTFSLANVSCLNTEIDNLDKRCKLQIKEGVRYACRWFSRHLAQVPWDEKMDNTLITCLQAFASRYLLNWVEVLSLTGELHNAVLSLREAARWLMSSPKPYEEVLSLFHDAERLVLMCYDSIQQSALQVYNSLPCVPTHARIRTAYADELKNKFEVTCGLDDHWNLCARSVSIGTTVKSLAISASGHLIASAGDIPGVQLWDTLTADNIGYLHGNGTPSCPVMFSPSGDYVAIGCDSGAVNFWDVTTGIQLLNQSQVFHDASVTALSFSSSNLFMASGAADATIRVWDILAKELKHSFAYHKGQIQCLSFSPNSSIIASGSDDKRIITSDVHSGKLLRRFEGHASKINSLSFSTDGEKIASGSDDQTARLWDTRTGVCLRTLAGAHKKPVCQVWVTADNKHVVSVCNNDIYLWEISTPSRKSPRYVWSVFHYARKLATMVPAWYAKVVRLFPADAFARLAEIDDGTLLCVAPSPDGRTMGCARGSSVLFLELFAPQKSLSKVLGTPFAMNQAPLFVDDSEDTVTAIAMTLDAAMLVTSDINGVIKLWNTSPRSNWETFQYFFKKSTEGFWPAPDGRSLLVKRMIGIQLVAPAGMVIKDLVTRGDIANTDVGAVPSPDSKYFAYWAEYTWNVDKSFSIHIYDASTGVRLKRIPDFFKITCGRFSAQSDLFACAHGDGVVQIWVLPSVLYKTTVTTGHATITALEFVPGNVMLVVGSDQGCVEIRLVENGNIVHHVKCSPSKVWALAVPNTAFFVVVGHEDGSLFLWDPPHASVLPHCLLPKKIKDTSDSASNNTESDEVDGIDLIKFTGNYQSISTRSQKGVVCTWDLTRCLAEYAEGQEIIAEREAVDPLSTSTKPPQLCDLPSSEPSHEACSAQNSSVVDIPTAPLTSNPTCPHLVSRSDSNIVYDRYFRSTYSVDNQGGWVYRGSRRMFWLHNDLRPASPTDFCAFEDRLVIVTRSRAMVFFDLRPMVNSTPTLRDNNV